MKCKHCGHATIYKVRQTNGGQCERCGHKFAFEPKTDTHTIGDPLFDRAIQLVSAENTVFFTPRQLWYEVERRLRRKRLSGAGDEYLLFAFIGFVIGGIVAWAMSAFMPLFIGLGVAALFVVAKIAARIIVGRRTPHPAMDYSTFHSSYHQNLVHTHGEMKKLVPSNGQQEITPSLNRPTATHPSEPPVLINLNTATQSELERLPGIGRGMAVRIVEYRQQGHVFTSPDDLLAISGIGARTLEVLRPYLLFEPVPGSQEGTEGQGEISPRQQEAEPDLTGYSFDRVVITDRAETAAMLVANNFHFENNCAVLSVDGYPVGNADTVLTMLRRNPELQVYALHDASVQGCSLPVTLREERWFPDPAINIVDLGLRPRHAMAMGLFTVAGTSQAVPDSLKEVLAPEEVVWLEAGYVTEVSVLRPSRLIQAIYQGFSRGRELDSEADRDSEREHAYATSGMYYYGGFYGSDSFG